MNIPPILTNGLGSNASNLILGQYQLGFIEVEFEDIPIGGQDYKQHTTVTQDKVRITFKIHHGEKYWTKSYVIDKKRMPIIIRILNYINTVTTNISVRVHKMRKIFKLLGIRKK